MPRLMLLADINSVHTRKWVEGLLSKGFVIHLFSLSASKDQYAPHPTNFDYTCLFENDTLVKKDTGFAKLNYFKGIGKLRKIKQVFQPELIHAHYASSYGTLALLAGLKPYSVSCWGSEVFDFPKRSWLHKILFKKVIASAECVYSTSYRMKTEIATYVEREINVIPFGIDTEKFRIQNTRTPREKLVIGTVKALEDVYGIDRLLEAYALFNEHYTGESELRVYGKGSKETELKLLANQLGISDKVSFCGFVSGKDLLQAYEQLDVFCALSRQESFGVSVLEASAMNLPVIVSDAGGLPEVVKHNETGFIIDGGEPSAVANSILALVESDLRIKMGAAGRAFVLENYSFQENLEQQLVIYQKQLEHGR
jgi:L-malate glycosyltransferase